MTQQQTFIGDRVVEPDFGIHVFNLELKDQTLSDYLEHFVRELPAYQHSTILVDPNLVPDTKKSKVFKTGFARISYGGLMITGFQIVEKDIVLLSANSVIKQTQLTAHDTLTEPIDLNVNRWAFEAKNKKVEVMFLTHVRDHVDHGAFHVVHIWDK